MEELQQELDLRNAQLADLQQQILSFNEDKEKDKAVDRYRYHTPQFVELDMRHFGQPH